MTAPPEAGALDMNRTQDRNRLRLALKARGILAYDSDLGGGLHALEIALIPDSGREALSIVVGSLDAPCAVALAGFRTEAGRVVDCASAASVRSETVAQTVAAVEAFWIDRDVFVRDFRASAYDLM